MEEKQAPTSFEENLKTLEQIVTSLEKGDFQLNASLKLFEKGVKLVGDCQKQLEEAERKVSVLTKETGKEEAFPTSGGLELPQ